MRRRAILKVPLLALPLALRAQPAAAQEPPPMQRPQYTDSESTPSDALAVLDDGVRAMGGVVYQA